MQVRGFRVLEVELAVRDKFWVLVEGEEFILRTVLIMLTKFSLKKPDNLDFKYDSLE